MEKDIVRKAMYGTVCFLYRLSLFVTFYNLHQKKEQAKTVVVLSTFLTDHLKLTSALTIRDTDSCDQSRNLSHA